MYTFVKILKVSNKKREIKHKTSKLTEPLKLIHGREARVPWTPDEVPLAQSPSHKRRKGRNPQLDGITQTQTARVIGANKLADSAGTGDSWPETRQAAEGGWESDSPGHWALGTLLGLCNMLTHSSIQQPCWKGLLPSLYQCAYSRRNPVVPLPSSLPPNCPGPLATFLTQRNLEWSWTRRSLEMKIHQLTMVWNQWIFGRNWI